MLGIYMECKEQIMQKVIIRKTKMQSSYLLVLFTILSLSCGQIPTVALQTNYCEVFNLATPELILKINLETSSRNRSTQAILGTQFYEIEGNTISLAYISDSGSLLIQETGDNLISSLYTEDIANQLVFIDSRNEYMIAIEITDGVNAVFNYVLLKADLRNSMTLIKYRMSSTDSGSSSIADLRLKKIVQISGNTMYVLMQGKQRTSVFKIDLSNQGDMVLLADLSNTTSLDIVAGNVNHLYDASTMRFYELSGEAGSEQYTPTLLSELNIDSIIDLETLKFTELNNLVLLSSTLNNKTIIIPIDQSPISPARAIKIEATSPAAIYTDKFKNFIAVTSKDYVWIRSTEQGLVYNEYSLALPIGQRDQLQSIFHNAKFISFDRDYAMVISKNVGNNRASLTSVLYDPSKTPYFTILDKLNNALNLDSADFTQLVTPDANQKFITSFKCNCVSLQVEKIQCFANALKCITVTKPTRVDCTRSTQISTQN